MLLNKSFEASRLNVLEAVSPVSLLVEEPYRAEKQISRRGSHTARGIERERESERERERARESERERERERERDTTQLEPCPTKTA